MTPPRTTEGQNENEGMLDSFDLEQSDRLSTSVEIASLQSETRALLGRALNLPRGIANLNRRNVVGGRNRWTLGLLRRPGDIDAAIQALVPEGHPNRRNIVPAVRRRFNELLTAYGAQGRGITDQLSNQAIVGRALLDALYENIKETDLEFFAANTARNAIIPGVALPAGNPNAIADHFSDAGPPPRLTRHGLDLLERLRRGNTNPAKVLLAFSAALDSEIFDPQITGVTLPAVGTRAPRLNLRTDVLEAPAEGMNTQVYGMLARIAENLKAYENTPEDQLEFIPPTPPPAGPGMGTAHVEFSRSQNRYNRAVSLVAATHASMQRLETYFTTGTPPPARPGSFANLAAAIGNLAAVAGGTIPRPTQTRDIVASGIGEDPRTPEAYREDVNRNDSGLMGADACDKILAEYYRRVSGVDDVTAKAALAATTGRVTAAKEEVRLHRNDIADIEPDPDARDQIRAFNRKNRSSRRVFDINLIGRRSPHEIYQERLLHLPSMQLTRAGRFRGPNAMSGANSLNQLMNRYYTLWYATNIIPPDNERHLPLTPQVAAELTTLRRAIVQRNLQNIATFLQRRGVERLSREDVESLGLRGANIENLPYEELQSRLMGMLTVNTLTEPYKSTAESNVERAWSFVRTRKDASARRYNWVTSAAKTTAKVASSPVWVPAKYLVYKPTKFVGNKVSSLVKWGWHKLFQEKSSII